MHDRSCACSRRTFLKTSAGLSVGMLMADRLAPLLGQEAPRRHAKSIILLWMGGGPSHLDTFDLKPGQPTGGPFKPVETAAKDIQICEHLPRLAKQMKSLSVIRTLTSREADHGRAHYLLHTGKAPQETVVHPSIGSVAMKEWPETPSGLPSFVSIGGEFTDPGFLGMDTAPLVVANAGDPASGLVVPEHLQKGRFDRRLRLLERMNGGFAERSDKATIEADARVQRKAIKMLGSKAAEVFDISKEPEEIRAAYGDSDFGRGCLLARRLVGNGVRFVEVSFDAWDTHADNFNQVKANLDVVDPAFATLTEELEKTRLIDETVVVWMGEFGRTPEINAEQGRDHWSDNFCAVVGGGGIAGGRVVGRSNDDGIGVKDRPVGVPDLFATLFHAMGFDPGKKYVTPEGRPITLVEKGSMIRELL